MKKIISVILAVAAAVAFLPAAAADNTDTRYIKCYFKDDFNSGITNFRLMFSYGNKLSVADKPSSDNKSLCFDSSAATVQSMSRAEMDTSVEENILFEFDICPTSEYNDISFRLTNSKAAQKDILTLSGLKLKTASGVDLGSPATDVFTNICIAFDPRTGLADYYVNKALKAAGVKASENFGMISAARFIFNNAAGGLKNTLLYIDNFKAYNSEKPIFVYRDNGENVRLLSDYADDGDVAEYMGDAAALYRDNARLYLNGAISNEASAPLFIGGKPYIPLETAKKLYASANSLPVYSMGGSYVSAEELCRASGKKLSSYSDGLIVIGNREDFFDFKYDIPVFRTLCGKLILHETNGKEMANYIRKNLNGVHPRLFMNSDDFERLKSKVQTDDYLKARHTFMLSVYGEAYTKKDKNGEYEHKLFVDKLASDTNEWTRTESVFNKIQQVGYCYRMTGDEKYAKRCIDEVLGICEMPSWIASNRSFLATAGLMIAVALCYDWMYDSEYMTADNKNTIKRAMETKGMDEILKDYEGTSSSRSYFWAQSPKPDNWNFVCNNAGLLSAMAFADVSSNRSVKIFNYAMKLLPKAATLYAPDGAWYEGPDYWEFGSRYFVMIMENLYKVFGTTFGFMELPGIRETGYYAVLQEGPMGSFNIGDAKEGDVHANASTSPVLLFLSSYFKDEKLKGLAMNGIREMTGVNVNPETMYNIAYYDFELPEKAANVKRDWYFRDSEIALMHKSPEDIQNDVFTALHAGRNDTPHGHLDAGQFVIDAYGTRFACDTGYESDSPSVKKNFYRYRTEGHNTILINPDLSPGQRVEAIARIDRFDTDGNSAIAVTDLTDMYENAESIKRGLKFTDNRSIITVQDEIRLNEPSDIWWFMHSKQKITVADDGQSAVISGNKNMDMLVKLSSSAPGSFTVMEAMPMEDSLKTISNNLQNGDFKKLALHFENTQNITISVTMSFIPKGSTDYGEDKTVTPIDSWTLDELPQGLNIEELNVVKKSYGFRADAGYTNSGEAEKARIILAVYEGGKVADIKIAAADIINGGGNLGIRYIGKTSGRTAKVYLWNKNNELTPIKSTE